MPLTERDKQEFTAWKRKVNAEAERLCGLSCDDLPDCDYYSWYDDGMRPTTAARRAIQASEE